MSKLPSLRTPDGPVKTLREWREFARRDDCLARMVPSDLRCILSSVKEKDAEIERLRALNAEMVEALNSLLACPAIADGGHDDPEWGCQESAAAAKQARAVLAKTEGGAEYVRAARYAASAEVLEAAKDALAGWRYIREHHGDLYGVGWDRVEKALAASIAKAETDEPSPRHARHWKEGGRT